MQKIVSLFLIILTLFISARLFAQDAYTLSGVVIDAKSAPIKGATVFISGSKMITATDNEGRFTFDGIKSGNYSISTKMLGYAALAQDAIVQDKSLHISIIMKVKPIMLNVVSIGTDANWKKHYALFKDQFLGTSENAKNCVILNPEIINFSSQKITAYHMLLNADTDDFLIIENRRLGYRVKYLLRTFNHNGTRRITSYDGDCYFEELEGTDLEKIVWMENRETAYGGSLMHYLRSVFAKTTVHEGFTTNELTKVGDQAMVHYAMNPTPVNFDMLVSPVDSSFVSFKFTALNIDYKSKNSSNFKKEDSAKSKKNKEKSMLTVSPPRENSQLLLHLDEAIIDARGSTLIGYRTFLIRGNWAEKRIGDQLPPEIMEQTLTGR
jgi:hypothetical protein